MNIFNRVIMVIIMLCLAIFLIIAIVNIFTNLFDWSTDVSDRVISFGQSLNPYILAGILFIVLVIALVILIFEFYRRKIKLANISTDQSGKTMVTIKTLSEQIRQRLSGIDDTADIKVKVLPRQDGIIIDIYSKLASGINVAEKIREIRETASDFASKNLGFKVLQTNYTATGFFAKKVKVEKEERMVKEEAPKDIEHEAQPENPKEGDLTG